MVRAVVRPTWAIVAIGASVVVLVAATRVGAAPPNDACGDASTVPAATRLEETVDTATATTAPDDPPASPGRRTASSTCA